MFLEGGTPPWGDSHLQLLVWGPGSLGALVVTSNMVIRQEGPPQGFTYLPGRTFGARFLS